MGVLACIRGGGRKESGPPGSRCNLSLPRGPVFLFFKSLQPSLTICKPPHPNLGPHWGTRCLRNTSACPRFRSTCGLCLAREENTHTHSLLSLKKMHKKIQKNLRSRPRPTGGHLGRLSVQSQRYIHIERARQSFVEKF